MNPDLNLLPALPRDEDGPVFKAPWEAQAFAMTLKLYERGHFTWKEWADHLAAEIAAAKARGEADLGDTYYQHWLSALEKIVATKGLLPREELGHRKIEWEQAAQQTEPGQPIELNSQSNDKNGG